MKYIALTLVILLLNSCRAAVYPLTEQEEALQAKFSKECKCEVSLSHSSSAIIQNRTDGIFSVVLFFDSADKYEYCSKQEKWLRIYSQLRVKQLLQLLSHKKNYKEINVVFYVYKRIDEDHSEATCSKLLTYNLSSGKMIYDVHR